MIVLPHRILFVAFCLLLVVDRPAMGKDRDERPTPSREQVLVDGIAAALRDRSDDSWMDLLSTAEEIASRVRTRDNSVSARARTEDRVQSDFEFIRQWLKQQKIKLIPTSPPQALVAAEFPDRLGGYLDIEIIDGEDHAFLSTSCSFYPPHIRLNHVFPLGTYKKRNGQIEVSLFFSPEDYYTWDRRPAENTRLVLAPLRTGSRLGDAALTRPAFIMTIRFQATGDTAAAVDIFSYLWNMNLTYLAGDDFLRHTNKILDEGIDIKFGEGTRFFDKLRMATNVPGNEIESRTERIIARYPNMHKEKVIASLRGKRNLKLQSIVLKQYVAP